MFARLLSLTIAAVLLWALVARDAGGAGPERRYRVQAGDTLWSIAVETYAGDPREGVWELRRRNAIDGALIRPGQVLVLPGA